MLQRLYVHNFRCLENFELSLEGRPSTLLIGKNGAGKSTVGAALRVLQMIARGTNRVDDLIQASDFYGNRTDAPMRFEVRVVLDGKTFTYELAFELPEGFHELRVAEERLVLNGKQLYWRDRSDIRTGDSTRKKDTGFRLDWHLVALPVIQERSDTDPLHVFKDWLARILILAPIPGLISGDSEGVTLLPNREVTNFGAWFAGVLAYKPAAYSRVDSYLKKVMSDLYDIQNPIVGRDTRRLSIQFRGEREALTLPFSRISDGEKCYLIAALAIAANEAYGPLLCFWDEPDNHLALSEVGHFVMELRRAVERGGQLLVTSHEGEAIRRFPPESTLVLYRRSHFEPTQIRRASELKSNGDLVNMLIRDDLVP